jgi:hypothetical protein
MKIYLPRSLVYLIQSTTCLCFLFLLILSPSSVIQASPQSSINSLPITNLSPFNRIYARPPLNTAPQLSIRQTATSLSIQVANYFSGTKTTSEKVVLDGETWVLKWGISHQIDEHWSFQSNIPFYYSDKGTLDNLIYQWHRFFHLPQGGRNVQNAYHFAVYYEQNNHRLFTQNSTTRTIGDWNNQLTYEMDKFGKHWNFNAALKLPTGSTQALSGSGSTDLGLGAVMSQSFTLGNQSLGYWTGVGLSYLGNSHYVLSPYHKKWQYGFRIGGLWQLTPRLQLKSQLDSTTALYSSNTIELGKPPLQLTMGGDIKISTKTRLELFFAEDLLIQRAPDITLASRLVTQF